MNRLLLYLLTNISFFVAQIRTYGMLNDVEMVMIVCS